MLEEFKKFIERGNVIDLAVGIIIGGAFQKIVTSLVEDIITPIISIPLGKMDFTYLTLNVGEATITYGKFITAVIDFVIMALVIFFIVRTMNKLNEKVKDTTSILDEKAKKIAEKANKIAKKAVAKDKNENTASTAENVATENNESTEKAENKTSVEENKDIKVCPFCYSEINAKATRCPHCTSTLEEKE